MSSREIIEDIVIRSMQDRATPEERRRVEEFRRRSPENDEYVRDLMRVWELTGGTGREVETQPPPAARIIAEARRRTGRERSSAAWWSGERRRLAAAALVVLGLGFAGGYLASRTGGADAPDVVEIATGASEMATTRLSDGTLVRLAPASSLTRRSDSDSREVSLEGRAFFAVAERADEPFTVHTRIGDLTVLGTRFGVGVERSNLDLVVVDGRVALSAADRTVEVSRGQMGVVVGGAAPSVRPVDDPEGRLDWMGRWLIFQSMPLGSVARELEMIYDVDVVIADAELEDRALSASFAEQELEQVLVVVCRALDVECVRDGRTVVITPR
ncbi:MAG: FecR family protein [Gemmatimonadota bacterium]